MSELGTAIIISNGVQRCNIKWKIKIIKPCSQNSQNKQITAVRVFPILAENKIVLQEHKHKIFDF